MKRIALKFKTQKIHTVLVITSLIALNVKRGIFSIEIII